MEEVGEGADVDEFEQNKEKLKINSVIVSNYANSKIGIARETKARFCCGYLLGKFEEALVKVYDLIELDLSLFENVDVSLPLSDSIVTELALIRASVPVGIDFVGFFVTQPENGNIEVAEHLLSILKTLEDLKYVDVYLVCLIKPSMSLWHATYDEEQLECIGDVVEEELDISNQPIFRLRQDYVINWLVHTGAEGFQIENEKVQDELLCNKSAFLINEIGVVLYESGEGNSLPNWNCKELTNELKKVLELKRWPSDSPNGNIVDVTSLTKITQSISERNMEEDIYENKCFAPVLLSQKISGECITIKVSLDVLVTASMDVSTKKLLYMFRDGIYRQQSALGLLIKKNQCNFTYEPLHFCPANSKIPITVLLPFSDFEGIRLNEDSYKTYRTSLHQRFLLPDDRPLFKKCLSIFDGRSTYHLVNPHEGLSSPKIDGGVVALVNGKYSYHHYMQDNFDDNIWGCAYRSLQTLASWFWFQGYTDKTYPSHKEIQEALVAIGDKEKSFVGSNEWIGSMEVSYCLDHLFGVTSKTLHVSTGADMAYKGRELYQHFKDHGTPIMIGGGVLAHTIVGVVYNEQTGDIRYLIVDPHFTGHEQLKTVLSKGWVGWKGPEFWNQNAHYNLCMPQRPKEI